MLVVISVFFNFPGPAFWPSMCSVPGMFHVGLKGIYSAALGWNLYVYIKSNWSNTWLKANAGFFVFCLDDLSIDISETLKSPGPGDSQVAQWSRIHLQCKRCKSRGFNPWVGRSPGEGNGNPLTPVFLPGKSHGQRSLAGYSPRGGKESDMTEHACITYHYYCVSFSLCVC